MPTYFSGYRTAGSDWIEAILQDANAVSHVTGYSSGGIDYLVFAHEQGVCAATRDRSTGTTTKKGWLDQSHVTGLALDETHLYVAHGDHDGDNDGNIGRIALSDLFDADADQSSDYTADYGQNNGMFHDAAAHDVYCICSANVGGNWWLAFGYHETAFTADPYYVALFKTADSTTYRSTYANGFCGTTRVSLGSNGMLAGSFGASLWVIEDITSISAHNFSPDFAFGNMGDDDFEDGVVATNSGLIYTSETGTASSVSESGGYLTISHQAGDSDSSLFSDCGFIGSDFDVVVTGLGGVNPTLSGSGDYVYRQLNLRKDGSNYAAIQYYFQWSVTNGRVEAVVGTWIKSGGTMVVSNSTNLGAAPNPSTIFNYKTRVKRQGATVTTYHDLGAGSWTQHGTYSSFTTDTLFLTRKINLASLSGATADWHIYNSVNDDPQAPYSVFGARVDLAGLQCGGTSEAPILVLTLDQEGAARIDYNVSSPADSTVTTYGAAGSGKDHEVLASNDCRAIALACEDIGGGIPANPNFAWVASHDAGVDLIRLSDHTATHINSDSGKTLDNQVHAMAFVGSVVYGTGAGASTPGAGFLTRQASLAPEDTDVAVRGHSLDRVLIGWDRPSDDDYAHSLLYR